MYIFKGSGSALPSTNTTTIMVKVKGKRGGGGGCCTFDLTHCAKGKHSFLQAGYLNPKQKMFHNKLGLTL